MNDCVLIGKVVSEIEMNSTSRGTQVAHLLLEVDRNFKNEDGTLGSDVFNITLWRGVAEDCMAIVKPGSMIAVKGRLQGSTYEKNEKTYYNASVVAEKVDFLSERVNALKG